MTDVDRAIAVLEEIEASAAGNCKNCCCPECARRPHEWAQERLAALAPEVLRLMKALGSIRGLDCEAAYKDGVNMAVIDAIASTADEALTATADAIMEGR